MMTRLSNSSYNKLKTIYPTRMIEIESAIVNISDESLLILELIIASKNLAINLTTLQEIPYFDNAFSELLGKNLIQSLGAEFSAQKQIVFNVPTKLQNNTTISFHPEPIPFSQDPNQYVEKKIKKMSSEMDLDLSSYDSRTTTNENTLFHPGNTLLQLSNRCSKLAELVKCNTGRDQLEHKIDILFSLLNEIGQGEKTTKLYDDIQYEQENFPNYAKQKIDRLRSKYIKESLVILLIDSLHYLTFLTKANFGLSYPLTLIHIIFELSNHSNDDCATHFQKAWCALQTKEISPAYKVFLQNIAENAPEKNTPMKNRFLRDEFIARLLEKMSAHILAYLNSYNQHFQSIPSSASLRTYSVTNGFTTSTSNHSYYESYQSEDKRQRI